MYSKIASKRLDSRRQFSTPAQIARLPRLRSNFNSRRLHTIPVTTLDATQYPAGITHDFGRDCLRFQYERLRNLFQQETTDLRAHHS